MFSPQCWAEIDSQNALTRIGDFMVGTWVPADQQDENGPRKHVYAWALDRKFVRTNGELDPAPWHGYMGVDLKYNQVGWWGFFADGTSGVIYLTKFTEKEWIFEGDDFGPNGKFRRKVTVKIPADGKISSTIEDTLDGETTVVQQDWVRYR
ncbi:hypothetical protein [Novipirellula artificiosorum]|nr:hypothetical protein [Novipirellula artificiosorum]